MKKFIAILVALAVMAPMAAMASGQQAAAPAAKSGPIEVRVSFPEIVNAVFAPGEDRGNNLWTKRWEKQFNVKIIVDWISAEYDTQMNLAIASGKLPDIFHVNAVQLNQLAEAKQLANLRAAYDANAGVGLRKMMSANQDIVNTGVFNGELLAMPRLHYGYETSTAHIWARKDWLQGIKMTKLTSFADLETMAKEFKSKYGAAYGIMIERTLGSFFQLAPAFHAYPQLWVEGPNNTIIYGATMPETKVALAKWAEWYKAGYVRSDFGTLNTQSMLQDAFQGKVGMYAQQNWAGWQVGSDMIKNQGENSYFIPMDLPSIKNAKIMYPITFPNSVYNVVRKGFANPEVLVKLVNDYIYVLDESIAAGGMTIDQVLPFNTNDMHHVTGPFKVEFAHYRDIQEVSTAVKTGVAKFSSGNGTLFYNEIRKYLDKKDLVGFGRWIQMGDAESSLVHALKHVDNKQLLFTKMWGVAPQELRQAGSTLDDLLLEGYTKIITGVEPIAYYDTLIQNWRKAGGDTVTAAVNKTYGKK